MKVRAARATAWAFLPWLVVLPLACGGGGGAPKAAATSAPAAAAPAAPRAAKAAFVPVDACALITKAEVEALVGRKTLEPTKDEMANLVTCTFGDPDVPQVAGRAVSQVLTLAVFTGEEGAYFAGPAAQAKDAFETARTNAASHEEVAGLGEAASWDKTLRTLSVHKGRYFVTATVDGELEAARKVVAKAIERLP